MWDTLFLNKIPENMIFNPCVVGNFDGVWKMLKAKAVYDAEQIKDLIVVDMNPNSDDIDRTYTLTFYKNSYEIKRLEGICKFEPSLLRQGIFYYKASDIGGIKNMIFLLKRNAKAVLMIQNHAFTGEKRMIFGSCFISEMMGNIYLLEK